MCPVRKNSVPSAACTICRRGLDASAAAPDAYESYLAPLATEQEKINAVANDFLDTWADGELGDLEAAFFEDCFVLSQVHQAVVPCY